MSEAKVRPDCHLGHILLKHMREHSEKLCQIDGATGEQETFQSALSRSIALAKAFREVGFKSGDILAFGGQNNLDLHIPFYAAIFNGYPVVGVDPYYKYDEIRKLFEITSPKIAFCERESYSTYVNACHDLGLDTKVIIFGRGVNSLQEFLDANKDDEPEEKFMVAEFDTDAIYQFLICTSGTTGSVKVAAFHHQPATTWITQHAYGSRALQLDGRVVLNVSPVNWISSYFISTVAIIAGQCQLQSSILDNIDIIIDMINKYKPVISAMSPALVTSLLKRKNEVNLTCFRVLAVAGAKARPETMIELRSCMNKEALAAESYGSTETVGSIVRVTPDTPLGSCGIAYANRVMKLVDPETEEEITEANVPGELIVKDPGFTEYYNDPEETAKVFRPDGFFKTGDLLYRDENNFYFYVDRIKTLIKYRNFHIQPSELEDVIKANQDVSDVCVIGVDNPEDGQHPVACIVPRDGATVTRQEIKQLVSGKLSKQKELRGGVVFLKELPRTSTGKIARKKLLELVLNSKRE
ncbi:unnamed protein product [Leptosia nina]|uniref:Luciferin 4-monooxygenase n=1 Tax=Leptosia nina TaxID=320188 RepID=A0AAV1IXP9_9NEOP